jgi:hypothetical protein
VRGRRETLRLLPEGRRVPVYDRILIDRVAARIWLRDFMALREEHDPQSWMIHEKGGRVVARLRTPAGFDLMHVAADRLVGVNRDEIGVEYVRTYALARPTR